MKSIPAFSVLFAAIAAQAAPVWEANSYDPASWTHSANLLRGLESVTEPVYYSVKNPSTGHYMEGTSLSTRTLTDGIVPGASAVMSEIVGLSGGTLQWNFSEPEDISELRIFSRWSDGGRDGISITRVEYLPAGASGWIAIADENNPCSVALDNNASFGHYCAALKDPENVLLATDAASLRVVLSDNQDNDGSGYVEIEAIGDPNLPFAFLQTSAACISATVTGTIVNCGNDAESVSVSCALAPLGEEFPADTSVAENKAVNDTFSMELPDLRWNTAYQYRITLRNNLGRENVRYGSFTTEAERVEPFPSGIGLWEVRIDGNGADWTTDAWAIEEGSGVNQRHRELGAEMAYSTGSHDSTINGQTYSWINNSVFAYVGYIYLQGNTDYIFESSIDDTAYLKIGDEVVHNITTYTETAKSYWTSGKEGWYPIDLRVGDYGGGHGPINKRTGFHFTTDGGKNWTRFLDPGDQSRFCLGISKGIQIDSAVNIGTSLRLGLVFSDAITGATVTACYGARYGAENTEAWTTQELDPVAEGEEYRSLTFPIPGDTEFFRIMYAKDGITRWTDSLRLSDYPVVNPATPAVSPGEVLSATVSSATLTANVIHTGDRYNTCDIEIAYGTTPSALQHTETVSNQAEGLSTFTLEGLAPDRTYYVRVRASNADVASAWSEMFFFRTQPLAIAPDPAHPDSLPGLWQARVDGSSADWETEILDRQYGTAATDRRRALGAQMAYCRNNRANDFEPSTTDSWTGNSTWVYRGVIFLEAGDYQFRSCMDDTAYIKIGETVVHDFPTYTAWAGSSWTCPATGWYELDLRVGNGGGDAGPMKDNQLEEGLQFSTDGGTSWHQFLDPGDGSFLCTVDPLRDFSVASFSTAGGVLSARLSFAPSTCTYTLCVAYGTVPGGENPESWENTAEVTTISGDMRAYSYTGLSGSGTNVKFARFYLLDADGDIRWADPIYLPDPDEISVSSVFTADAHLGDSLVVSGSLVSSGASENASVSVLVSASEDLSNPVVWPVGNYASGDTFTATLHEADTASERYIAPGSDYYIAILAQAADGAEDRSDILPVRTHSGSKLLPSVSAESAMWDVTFRGGLETFGAGEETTIELWTGTSADTLTRTDSVAVTEAGAVSFTVSFDAIGTIYYQFRASNACQTVSWTDETAVTELVMQDNATYYWKAGVGSGAWSDHANWENSLGDSRLRFPNSTQATASFERCADCTIVVALDGDYTVKNFAVSAKNLNLTLRGTGVETSRLNNSGDLAMAQDETFLLDNAYLYINKATFSDRCSIRTTNNAYLYSHTEWSSYNTDMSVEITDDSRIHIQNFLFRLNGTRPLLRIHDGTLTQAGTLAPNSNGNAIGVKVEFSGTHPYLAPSNITPSEQNGSPSATAEKPLFNFIIPEEGFDEGPRISLNNNFPNSKRIPIRFEVDASSPWFRSGRTKSFKLVKAKEIYTDYVDFSEQPRDSATRYYYTYGNSDSSESDGKSPTGLWVEVQGFGTTIIIIR